MRKCNQCRELDVELLTKCERFKEWLFYKINNIFFHDDFEDLKSQKYTQGVSDGGTDAIKHERSRVEIEQLRYNVEPHKPTDEELTERLNELLSNVDLDKIVSLDKTHGVIYIGGERADNGRLTNLKAEAEFLVNSEIWTLLYETPKELAQRAMFVQGESLDDMKKGKSILYTLSTQQNIINTLKSYLPK